MWRLTNEATLSGKHPEVGTALFECPTDCEDIARVRASTVDECRTRLFELSVICGTESFWAATNSSLLCQVDLLSAQSFNAPPSDPYWPLFGSIFIMCWDINVR